MKLRNKIFAVCLVVTAIFVATEMVTTEPQNVQIAERAMT
ncbi:PhrC/PhrF family phosphatase-inhibitory pheromone [Bacillus sp. z60-11]